MPFATINGIRIHTLIQGAGPQKSRLDSAVQVA